MLTRLQWFNRLPKDVRQKAIVNHQREMNPSDKWTETYPTLVLALSSSFIFKTSPEGEDYWLDVIKKYNNN